MKVTLSKSDFRDAFFRMERGENFSYEGLGALFDFLEESGEEMELDVIGLCCDFSEYASFAEFQKDYGKENYSTLESVKEATTFIKIDDESFIIANF